MSTSSACIQRASVASSGGHAGVAAPRYYPCSSFRAVTFYVQSSSNRTSEQGDCTGCAGSHQGCRWGIMTVTTHLSSNFTEPGWNWVLVLWLLYLPHWSSMLYVSTLSDQSVSQISLCCRFNLKSHYYHTLVVENDTMNKTITDRLWAFVFWRARRTQTSLFVLKILTKLFATTTC